MEQKRFTLREIEGDLKIYFNWSANALFPFDPHAADVYLTENKYTILKVAQYLLNMIGFVPSIIYRGVILPEPATLIMPHKNLQYLSFSRDRLVAAHFANVNGFGSEIMDIETRLGKFGYIIEFKPMMEEVLFHSDFLSLLPYAEAFSLVGMDGSLEVENLRRQKEVTILQPSEPFTKLTGI